MEAMRRAVTDGEQHLRPTLDPAQFASYVAIGLGLRDAFRDPARQGEFVERLKPVTGASARLLELN